jgi:hypothetical protein
MSPKEQMWLKLFRCSCLIVLLTGILPSLAVLELTQEPWRWFYDVLTWPLDSHPATLTVSERQFSAVIGGVICGWALLMYRLSSAEVFTPAIRSLLVQSVWFWFLVDSIGSLISGLPLNALSNLGFLLILLVPLSALKK